MAVRVLFVCLGNICRSPLAEAALRAEAERLGLDIEVDSANLRDLRRLRPEGAKAELSLLLDHVPGRAGQAVADPYHGGDSHFDATWADVAEAARALAAKLAAQAARGS